MRTRLLAGALLVAAATHFGAAPAGARTNQHCVVRVTGATSDRQLVTSLPSCFDRFDDAMTFAGGGAGAAAAASSSTTTFIIGIHYDGLGFTGSSFSVVGSDCLGGWLNAPAGWNNRIRSTVNGCARVRHFDGANLTYGTYGFQDTVGSGGNLSTLDRRTSSIQYLS